MFTEFCPVTSDEQAKIEVRWDDTGQPLLAEFRAWVGRIRYIPYRANIITCFYSRIGGVPIQDPTWSADEVVDFIGFNNLFLWQAGLQLAPDTDPSCFNGATLLRRGVYSVNSKKNYTFNQAYDRRMVAPLLNSRAGVLNIAFIHSFRDDPQRRGAAVDRGLSPAEQTVTSAGSPSASWVQPSGVWPDDPAQPVAMQTFGPSTARDRDLIPLCGDGAIDQLCALVVLEYERLYLGDGGGLLAHELGHILGLRHRGSGGWTTGDPKTSDDGVDHRSGPHAGLGHPWDENAMSYGDDKLAQNFDMLQAQVMRNHPLVSGARPAEPVDPLIPTAWTPTQADVILMQEYLCGKRPGLINSGYDLGTTGPDGDGVDGDYGPRTTNAVAQFQAAHGGLLIDGVYGPNTRDGFAAEIQGTQ